jgi:cell division transport system permease protein
MRKKYPELFKTGLPSNPLPPSEEVELRKAEDAEAVAAEFSSPAPPGVDSVSYGKKTAKRIIQVARVIEIVFLLAIVILFVASTLLIANTIRLSIFARRREIEVMKLVGATNWFVRGPFMLEGLICGLVGSVAAVVLLLVGKEVALPALRVNLSAGDDVNAVSFWLNALALVGAGLLLGAAGSGITLRRFLRV